VILTFIFFLLLKVARANGICIMLPPTGKKIIYTGGIWRIVDGKVVERKSVHDMLGFLVQIGLIEYTEKVKKLIPKEK
jgi:predicted ester cyclase